MTATPPNSFHSDAENSGGIKNTSVFRRVLSQFLAVSAKNIIDLNVGGFVIFSSIIIPSLVEMNTNLTPDETLQLSRAETSWLACLAYIAHPIGSLFGGLLGDIIGRRRAIMIVCIPLAFAWALLGFAQSFLLMCLGFILIGFCFGLKDASSLTYVSEISEPSMRGALMSSEILYTNLGNCIILAIGTLMSWRYVSFICTLFPIGCLLAMYFVPESPTWLLAGDYLHEAENSIQWLRGWVSPQKINTEFIQLQNYSKYSNSCVECSKRSITCIHPKQSFLANIREMKRQRHIKPIIFMFSLQFFSEFSGYAVWQPYTTQILDSLGAPINGHSIVVIGSGLGVLAGAFLVLTVHYYKRRKIYLISSAIVATCCFGLSFYGFILLPDGWMSFRKPTQDKWKDAEYVRNFVGDYNYIAFAFFVIMQFATKVGVSGMANLFIAEIFPFKTRSLFCGIAIFIQYVLASIARETYFYIERWLSLPGAILFYGWISVIGFYVMYLIMPETEEKSLEDIELHYSDNVKAITDTHIDKVHQNEDNSLN